MQPVQAVTPSYIKTYPVKNRLFAESCKEMGAQYQSLLFYSNSRWLSRGNVACVYNLRVAAAAALFLEDENLVHAEHFISKLAHLRVHLSNN
jgi:hypothetical protein